MKIFVASFNRASDGAVEHLVKAMKKRGIYTNYYKEADYILACGDRTETFDFVLERFRENKPIIHLWAGECDASWSTHDECYRSFITFCSMLQLCTNPPAKNRVEMLCTAVGKKPNAHVVGNVMLDDLSVDESLVPKEPYVLVLYNPSTLLTEKEVESEIAEICTKFIDDKKIWIEPNGDNFSELVMPYVTHKNLPRKQFLGLMKNCRLFITNSSCQYYEAPSFLKPEQIVPVGLRNIERESKYVDMDITGASDKIIELLEDLKEK